MESIIFWYTGAFVWGIIASAVAAALVVTSVLGCIFVFRYSAGWIGLRVISGAGLTLAEAQMVKRHIDEIGTPGGVPLPVMNEWLRELGKRCKSGPNREDEAAALRMKRGYR